MWRAHVVAWTNPDGLRNHRLGFESRRAHIFVRYTCHPQDSVILLWTSLSYVPSDMQNHPDAPIQNEGSIVLTESFPFIDQDLTIHHGLEQFLVTNGLPIHDPDLGTEEILQLICEFEDVSHADEFS